MIGIIVRMPLRDGYSIKFMKILIISVLDLDLVGCKIYGAKKVRCHTIGKCINVVDIVNF